MGLSFLNPLYLLGALAAAVPVIIHLVNRRRAPPHRFPAMAYLLGAKRRRSRQLKVRHLLLLALRMAALVLLAFALARPFLAVEGLAAQAGIEPAQAVIVVDTSMSMGLRGEAETRLEAAKRAATEAVDALGPGARVSVLSTEAVRERPDGGVDPAKPLTLDLGSVKREIEALRVTHGEADLRGALRRAYARLAESPWGLREIVVVTDLQRHGWEPVSLLALGQVDAGLPIRLLDVGLPRAGNVAVVAVTPPTGPLAEGVLARVGARIANFGDEARAKLLVQLAIDGRRVDQKFIDLPPRGEVETGFAVPLDQAAGSPGLHAGSVEVVADALPLDDTAWFTYESVGKLDIVVVDGDPRRTLLAAESFYLAQALNPERDSQSALLVPRVITLDELARADLSRTPAVYLLNPPSLPEGARRQLAAFVERGGAVIVAAGDQLDPVVATRELYASGTRLLPGPLAPPRPLGPKGARIRVADPRHPVVEGLGRDGARLLGSAAILAVLPIQVPQGDPLVRTILALEDGTPLLVERRQGAGRLVYFGTTVDLGWTDLPARAAFLPFVQSLTLALAVGGGAPPPPPHVVGRPWPIPTEGLPANAVVRVTDPRGRAHALTAHPEGARPPSGADGLEFGGVDLPGVYRVEAAGRTIAFAAAVPRAESDLMRISEAELLGKLPKGIVRLETVREAPDDAAEAPAGSLPAQPLDLSFYALAALLLTLGAESLLGAQRR